MSQFSVVYCAICHGSALCIVPYVTVQRCVLCHMSLFSVVYCAICHGLALNIFTICHNSALCINFCHMPRFSVVHGAIYVTILRCVSRRMSRLTVRVLGVQGLGDLRPGEQRHVLLRRLHRLHHPGLHGQAAEPQHPGRGGGPVRKS